MKKLFKIAALIVVSSLSALAAPMFSFTSSMKMNAMMKGDTIELSAYPNAKLVYRSVAGSKATLVFEGANGKTVFAYYEAAFKKQGWKAGEAMMGGDKKPADTMDKPAGAMDKPADAMDKPAGAMDKPEAMMGSAMMKDGSFQGHYTTKGHTLAIGVIVKDGKTFANFGVK
jgi:hypothetical protein